MAFRFFSFHGSAMITAMKRYVLSVQQKLKSAWVTLSLQVSKCIEVAQSAMEMIVVCLVGSIWYLAVTIITGLLLGTFITLVAMLNLLGATTRRFYIASP